MNTQYDVTIASRAFGFLLDRYVGDTIPDPEIAAYLKLIIARRHAAASARAPLPSRTSNPSNSAEPSVQTDNSAPCLKYDPWKEAIDYIRASVRNHTDIDRVHLANLTGYTPQDLTRFIEGTITENIAQTAIAPLNSRTRPIPKRQKPGRGGWTEASTEKMRSTRAANKANRAQTSSPVTGDEKGPS